MVRKLARSIVLYVCIIGILLLIGCNNKNVYEIEVSSPVKEHSVFSSATPGLPLTVHVINDEKDKIFDNFNFSFSTEYGSLVTWKEIDDRIKGNYKVTSHGKELKINDSKMVKFFWSQINSDGIEIPKGVNEIIIDVKVYNNNSKLLSSSQIVIGIENWTSRLVEK